MTELHKDGYILLPKLISEQELQLGLSSMKNDQVDYLVMKNFIDTIFMKKISVSTDITNPIYMKFRFSNNNIEQVPTGYYYLYFYILYWIVSLIIIYIIAKMWYKSSYTMKRPFRLSKNRR
jgi:hypothetical protein